MDEGLFIWQMAFFAFFNRAASLYQFLSMSLLGGVNELLKVWFRDGRPFYLVESIEAYDCEDKDFGRPSGHVLSSATIFILIYLQYFDPHDIRGSSEILRRRADGTYDNSDMLDRPHFTHRRNRTLQLVFAIALAVVVVLGWLAEIMGGSNSLDQVLLGSSLGLGICLSWYLLRDELSIFFIRISEQVEFWSEKIWVIVYFLVGIAITLILMLWAHYWVIAEFNKAKDVPPEWVLIYEQKCGKVKHPTFYYLHLKNTYAYMLLFLGCILGVTFDSLVLGGTMINYNKTNEITEEQFNFPIKGFLRWGITVLQCILIKTVWQYFFPGSMRNLWVSELWWCFVPFLFYSVTKYLFYALRLTKNYITY